MVILEATPQSPGIGEAVLTGKSLPVDIPTNAAPTVVQAWAEVGLRLERTKKAVKPRSSKSHQLLTYFCRAHDWFVPTVGCRHKCRDSLTLSPGEEDTPSEATEKQIRTPTVGLQH